MFFAQQLHWSLMTLVTQVQILCFVYVLNTITTATDNVKEPAY